MDRIEYLGWDAPLADYEAQADRLWTAYRGSDPGAIKLFHLNLPRFLDAEVPWRPRNLQPNEIEDANLSMDDARMAVARVYSFHDWSALVALVTGVADESSFTRQFEQAVEHAIVGNVTQLAAMLEEQPELARARSNRVTSQDPRVHAATLLHYVAANGVEGYRQKSPGNAAAIARLLLDRGAEVDALANMYGGEYPTLCMLVSSTPPAKAGVQIPLIEILIDYGANPNGTGRGEWRSPLSTALVFGFRDAAATLVRRDALIDDITKAAGLGDINRCRALLPFATELDRHRALALAAVCGQESVVKLLVEAGEDPDRLNPPGFHSHSTPLHQAACAGHLAVVKLLVSLGARTDVADTVWHGDALGWAEHCNQPIVAEYLRTVTARP